MRRNAYHRLFGLDLNHGTDDNRPYPYPRAAAANTEFVATFEELLREVWRAIENVRNQVGANQTDVTTIANLARAIFDMLRVRRQENVGNLARDELWHVSTLDWFHLTLSFNTPIVRRPQGRGDVGGGAAAEDRRAGRPARAQPLRQLLPSRDEHVARAPRDGARDVQRRASGAPACSRAASSRRRCRRRSRTGRSRPAAT